jgi:hypothetical protein
MLVASIIWLYRGGEDKTWMSGLPRSWHAADAIVAMRDAGFFGDWALLISLYPGW